MVGLLSFLQMFFKCSMASSSICFLFFLCFFILNLCVDPGCMAQQLVALNFSSQGGPWRSR